MYLRLRDVTQLKGEDANLPQHRHGLQNTGNEGAEWTELAQQRPWSQWAAKKGGEMECFFLSFYFFWYLNYNKQKIIV